MDNIGRINFSVTFVGYFSYLAILGIGGYSVRNGSALRDDKKKITKFVSEVFTINVVATLIAYIFMFVLLLISNKLREYILLIMIISISIAFSTLGVGWVLSIFEDYLYITVRSILFNLISLVLMFLLVKDEEDIYLYAALSVLSNVGTGLLNWFRVKRYVDIRLTKVPNLKRHLLPIFTIFVSDMAILIYVSSDITMLGYMTSDYITGLYSFSTKIYSGLKTLLGALIIVSIPRLSYYWGKNKDLYYATLDKIFKSMISFMVPMAVGLIMVSKEVIYVLGGKEYGGARNSLILLCVAILFCELSYIYTQCILMPMHKEKWVMWITVVSALINIGLNLYLIPRWGQIGAAVTTILAEAIVYLTSKFMVRKEITIANNLGVILKTMIGCCGIILVCYICGKSIGNILLRMIVSIIFSIIVYFVIELVLDNSAIKAIVSSLYLKIRNN